MKFKIRDGFVVKIVNLVDVGEGQPKQAQEVNYYAGQVCDLTEQQAKDHAHKLEPFVDAKGKVDADAAAFLDELVVVSPPPPTNADIDRLVAEKVTAALLAVLGPQAAALLASKPAAASAPAA